LHARKGDSINTVDDRKLGGSGLDNGLQIAEKGRVSRAECLR
jgi:hypothetical protein